MNPKKFLFFLFLMLAVFFLSAGTGLLSLLFFCPALLFVSDERYSLSSVFGSIKKVFCRDGLSDLLLGAWALLFSWGISIAEAVGLFLLFDVNSSSSLTEGEFLVIGVFFAPVFEELLFRGYLLKYLEHKLNSRIALMISSSFFGILHLPFVLGALIFGLTTGALVQRHRSLWFGIILHAFNNGCAAVLVAISSSKTEAMMITSSDFFWAIGLVVLGAFPAYKILFGVSKMKSV